MEHIILGERARDEARVMLYEYVNRFIELDKRLRDNASAAAFNVLVNDIASALEIFINRDFHDTNEDD